MAPKSTFAVEWDWRHSFMLKSITNALQKKYVLEDHGGGGGARTPIIHVRQHLLYTERCMSDTHELMRPVGLL